MPGHEESALAGEPSADAAPLDESSLTPKGKEQLRVMQRQISAVTARIRNGQLNFGMITDLNPYIDILGPATSNTLKVVLENSTAFKDLEDTLSSMKTGMRATLQTIDDHDPGKVSGKVLVLYLRPVLKGK